MKVWIGLCAVIAFWVYNANKDVVYAAGVGFTVFMVGIAVVKAIDILGEGQP